MNLKSYKSPGLIRTILILHACVLIVFLAYAGRFLFIPLFFSFLVAVSLHPVCRWLEEHRLNRLIASILCIFILLFVGVMISYLLGSKFQRFAADLPSLNNKFDQLLQKLQQWAKEHYNIDESMQTNYVASLFDGLIKSSKVFLNGIFYVIINGTLCLFFIFYMLFYRSSVKAFVLSFYSRAFQNNIQEILQAIHSTIPNYIKGLLTEILILILLSTVTLLILGIKYAILMAFFAGLLNIIPYIGIYVAALLNMLITIVTGHEGQSLEVLLVFVIIHIIDANLITPLIVGRRIKLNPLATLIAVIVGKLVCGIPGMFLFIPLAAIINIILEKSLHRESNTELS
jgi:AI-2 transport protein TqsA